MVEVMISGSVLVIGCLGLSAAITNSGRLAQLNRERMIAHQAARAKLEEIENATFTQAFALYNASTADDPAGIGTAPGPNFAVTGLTAIAGDPDGLPGQVLFPTVGGKGLQLTENAADARWNMPRDLNGDGVVSVGAMGGNYVVLPVRVIVHWRGAAGNSSLQLDTVLLDRSH